MLTSDLVSLLRLDIGDTAGDMLGADYLARCVVRAAYSLNQDTGTAFSASGEEVTPDPGDGQRELLLLKARINVCSLMRAVTAGAFSFKSGDKSVDKTKQPSYWADLQADLEKEYRDRVKQAVADGGVVDDADNGIMAAPALRPAIYEQGVIEDPDAAVS